MTRIIRAPALLDRLGIKKSLAYTMMSAGTLPRPIRLSPKAVGWPEHEIDAVLNARIAGLDEDAIRALVARLMAARAQAMPVAA